ncbi:uncharacterized protein FPRO_15135 [Fusarium proliferatum ET1]|uniref:Uncharacterized protein n=1 Tax=Fusarium proliferatum (strain ET1) TaxID=1227346 RepID=A0A1L7VZ35_FUSPR|nr:uncharacterized protein FPRO_15135 [Fusarium proliferatum ET1]CZR45689.1 uncharacterized protein FPRO_15135 [Fusarium proliferatum ET1]
MASTARPSMYDSENQHRRLGPLQDQDEDWSDSASDEQSKQNKSPQRNSKLRRKLPEHYRQHTSESASQFPDDSYIRQARNATVPYSNNYDPSHSPSYQAHSNSPMQYLPSPASQVLPEHPGWYKYPRQGGYLSVPRTRNPFAQPSGRSPYGHSFGGYPESGYGFDDYDYDQEIPPPPEYPAQDPLRTPVRPREPQIPDVQPERDTENLYRDEVGKKPRNKRSPTSKKAKTLPEDRVTNAEIMDMLRRKEKALPEDTVTNAEIMDMLRRKEKALPEDTVTNAEIMDMLRRKEKALPEDTVTNAEIMDMLRRKEKALPEDTVTNAEIMDMLRRKEKALPEDTVTNAEIMAMLRKIQQEVKENAEIRSDPGRQEYRGRRNLLPTSQFLLDDSTSVETERQKICELKGIIHRLLEDRRNQEYQDSYAGSSRSFADSHHNRIEVDHRESVLMRQRDLQSLESKLNHIIEHLEMGISPLPQQLLGTYNNRQGYHVPRHQASPVWDPSTLEPTSPTLSRPPSRRKEYTQPTGDQRQDTQASNEARLRQQPSCIPEAEEYLEACGDPRVPIRGSMQGRPLGPNRSNGSRSRVWSQPSVGQRSELRGVGGRIVPGDQHKVTPGRDPIVEFEDELESEEEPVRDRTRMPYLRRPRAPEPPAQSDWRNM